MWGYERGKQQSRAKRRKQEGVETGEPQAEAAPGGAEPGVEAEPGQSLETRPEMETSLTLVDRLHENKACYEQLFTWNVPLSLLDFSEFSELAQNWEPPPPGTIYPIQL